MAEVTAETAARQLRLLPAAVVREVKIGMTKHAERVMTQAKTKYVPVDQGILKNSGHVTEIKSDNTGIELQLAFGGPAKGYARIQHENTSFSHPGGGQAHYLKIPFDNAKPRGKKVISSAIAKARRGLGL